MAEKEDQIQQAADALRNLQPTEPAGQDAPAEQAAPSAEPSAADPFAELQSAAQEGANSVVPIRVMLKKVGKLKKEKPEKQKKPKKVRQPAPPPPALSPLQKVQRSKQIELRRTAIPPLMTMGLAMLVLGGWSATVLIQDVDFFHPGNGVNPNTTWLAKLALLAWPIAAVLLLGAGFFIYEVYCWFAMYPPEPNHEGHRAGG